MKVSARLIIIKWLKRFPPGKVKILSFRKPFCQNLACSPWEGSVMLKYWNLLFCGEYKAFHGIFHGGHGTVAHTRTGTATEKAGEAKFQRCFTETQAQARQPFDAENVPSHRRRTLHTSRKKEKQALHPPHSSLCALSTAISLLSWWKFVYICGVTLQVTSKTPTRCAHWEII